MSFSPTSILILILLVQQLDSAPQKDPSASDVIDDSADFGTPEHDNTIQHEVVGLSDTQIRQLIAIDYFTNSTLACDNTSAPGNWMVYCSGRLLQAVMAVQLYDDSKTFVDQPIKANLTGEVIMEEFEKRFPGSIENLTKSQVKEFVDEFFDKEGHELDVCDLPDWIPTPEKLSQINDPTYQAFAQRLHFIWIQLCRQMKQEVHDEPSRFSLLYIPHQFILPGGRFREFYYWDAYWIVKGLLSSQLYSTARNMIKNFAHIIDKYGFIPNGGRVYYLRRSQPPFFAPMVYEYYMATQDLQFVADMIPHIEKEHQFWTSKRQINITMPDDPNNETLHLYQYKTEANTPRPESFREDVISAKNFGRMSQKKKFFKEIGSAAESGWDFSSRWFQETTNLTSIETTMIVPVDLNSFICYNMNIMAFFYEQLSNPIKHQEWSTKLHQFRDSFTKVFYVPSRKGWYDFNTRTKRHNTEFFPSNAAPLFAQCYDPLNFKLAVDVFNQMDASGAFEYGGGIPTSLHKNTQQQWDFPNGWSPTNHMVIEGLRKSINPMLQQKAFVLAERWLMTNLMTFNVSNAMWEKYDVKEPHRKLATGGEYEVQAGFGWTNGAALDLLITYGDRLQYSGPHLSNLLGAPTSSSNGISSSTTVTTSATVSSGSTNSILVIFSVYLVYYFSF